jgi:hypothetical protein
LLFNATATSGGSGFGASVNNGSFSPYSTPFVLVEERDNKWKIDQRLKDTLEMKQAIPFLRTNDPEYKEIVLKKNKQNFRSNTIHGEMSPLGQTVSSNLSPDKLSKHSRIHESGIPTSDYKSRVTNFLKRREQNWQ